MTEQLQQKIQENLPQELLADCIEEGYSYKWIYLEDEILFMLKYKDKTACKLTINVEEAEFLPEHLIEPMLNSLVASSIELLAKRGLEGEKDEA